MESSDQEGEMNNNKCRQTSNLVPAEFHDTPNKCRLCLEATTDGESTCIDCALSFMYLESDDDDDNNDLA